VCQINAENRWCLTGTPIQNCLEDFGALLAFVRVPPLETKDSFYRYIVGPIKTKKKEGLRLLQRVVAATCLRRTKVDHASTLNLPQKTERVERVEMGRTDRRLYEFFKRFSYLTAGAEKNAKKKQATNILVLISMLRLICDNGEALLPESALTAWRCENVNALTLEMLESTIKRCVSCDLKIEELGTAESVTEGLQCGHIFCESCITKSQSSTSQPECPKCQTTGALSPSVLGELSYPTSSPTN
jgi:SWI/SNF-related matrix-associated actin-dependent regulator of chromatin subfamily A3